MDHAPLILHGNNFDSNRGCQALRLTTQMILDRYLPEAPRLHANIFFNDDPQFDSVEPDPHSAGQLWETRRRGRPSFYFWGASVVCARLRNRFPHMKVHHALDRAQALVVVGGDNLSYDYGFLPTLLFFSPLQAAIRKGVPSAIWAASIGPFSRKPAWQKRFAELLRKVDLITVRESVTQEYLAQIGVRENVCRTVDPAFLLPPRPTQLPPEIEQALQAGAVGINLAPLMTRYNRLSARQWLAKAVAMLAETRRKISHPILLIPHVMMPPWIYPDNDDYTFMQAVLRRLPPDARKDVFLYDARRDSCRQIKWVISRLKVFAGSRMHSTVAALSSCVPVFCIGYGIKSRGMHHDLFGHEQWITDVAHLASGDLAERIQAMLAEESSIRSHLKSVIPQYAQRAWENGEYLQALLRDRAPQGAFPPGMLCDLAPHGDELPEMLRDRATSM